MDAREKRAYLNATPQQREVARRLLVEVIALLQAQHLFYQMLAWKHGGGLAGTVTVFERLSGSSAWEASDIAGKVVGYFGPDALGLGSLLEAIQQHELRWGTHSQDPKTQCLRAEEDLQASLLRTVSGIKAVSAMTLGLDSALRALADKHEGNVLALQQDQSLSKVSSGTANHLFHDNPEKREVLQLMRGERPPTPIEIQKGPGGKGISTLNRFVIDSLDPRIAPAAAENHIRETPKSPTES